MSEIKKRQKNKIKEKELKNICSESVNRNFNKYEKKNLKAELIEGYKSTRNVNKKINKEFEETINDGLDED